MKTRRRRALSAEEASMTPAQRAEMREIGIRSRARSMVRSHRIADAIEKDVAQFRSKESTK
ncbi:hypothetical protein [Telluria beijingensis]|uniref:hypothetical protein n=1 Tax=Telluria beijingensis TaxID=3068633 RepID=UPI002795D479|nr:hypothetical protein [Massilia sp. REN29]